MSRDGQQLMDRYFVTEGQGLTEYAIILLLVVLSGVTLYTTNGIQNKISGIYRTVGTYLDIFKGSTIKKVLCNY